MKKINISPKVAENIQKALEHANDIKEAAEAERNAPEIVVEE